MTDYWPSKWNKRRIIDPPDYDLGKFIYPWLLLHYNYFLVCPAQILPKLNGIPVYPTLL